ncbi:MAG TPA: LysE family translocator [Terrimicrobiaceae bacterium]
MSAETVLLYLLTWVLVALTPGPAVMYMMSQVARHGLRAGFLGIVGIQLGNLAFFVCIGAGLMALLATATSFLAILQLVGAGYLIYFGLRMVSSSLRRSSVPSLRPPPGRGSMILQGLAIQLTNPKALLFVSALLPQFLDSRGHMMVQLTALLSCTIVVDVIVLGSYAFLADREDVYWTSRASGR